MEFAEGFVNKAISLESSYTVAVMVTATAGPLSPSLATLKEREALPQYYQQVVLGGLGWGDSKCCSLVAVGTLSCFCPRNKVWV